jgi:hypothetical protein
VLNIDGLFILMSTILLRESLKILIFFSGLLYDVLIVSEHRVLNIGVSVRSELKNICKDAIVA